MVARRKQLWITQSDGLQGVEWVGSGEEGWTAFVKEHPELTDR